MRNVAYNQKGLEKIKYVFGEDWKKEGVQLEHVYESVGDRMVLTRLKAFTQETHLELSREEYKDFELNVKELGLNNNFHCTANLNNLKVQIILMTA